MPRFPGSRFPLGNTSEAIRNPGNGGEIESKSGVLEIRLKQLSNQSPAN